MFPYQRLQDIFQFIYNNDVALPGKLASNLNISVRTLRSDISVLNDILADHGAAVLLKRGEGYYIDIQDKEAFSAFAQALANSSTATLGLETTESRIRYLISILLLSSDYLSLDYLADTVFVSTATLQNYLKSIYKILEEYDLDYILRPDRGVKLVGDEKNKRSCMINNLLHFHNKEYTSDFTNEEQFLFQSIDLDELKKIISDVFLLANIGITDMNLKRLTIHTALMYLRIKNEHYINFKNTYTIDPAFEDLLTTIIQILEDRYEIYISDGEKEYLYVHIISNADCNILDMSDSNVTALISRLLDCIYQDYSFDLRGDAILMEDLSKHMKSILSTKSLSLEKKNPLINTIRNNFPLPFEITLTCIRKAFTDLPFSLTEDDAGYIALHIGAAIERCFSGKYEAKNIILVSDGSHATARILEARLQNYYSNKINIQMICSCSQMESLSAEQLAEVDFIITTAPLKRNDRPVVIVDFALKKQDIEAISRMLNSISNSKWKKTMQFFDETLFIKRKRIEDKDKLLQDLCDMLQKQNIIEHDFLPSVIDREGIAKTNINEIFALPHAMKLCAKQTKVAVALLEEPVKWHKEETVQIIFLLATKQNEQANIEHLYDIVVEIVNNSALQKRILKCDSYSSFMEILADCI